jgi:hypothetical protein
VKNEKMQLKQSRLQTSVGCGLRRAGATKSLCHTASTFVLHFLFPEDEKGPAQIAGEENG